MKNLKRWIALLAMVVVLAGCDAEQQQSSSPSSSPSPVVDAVKQRTTAQRTTPTKETTKENTAVTTFSKEEASHSDYDATVTVTRVVDGDTVDVTPAIDGITRVRFIGVDTPELRDPDCGKQPYADEAKAYTTSELSGEQVGLEFDQDKTDQYDRLLAYVYKADEMFNEDLLEEGYAQVATFPPNVKYVDRFLAAQEEARTAEKGLWGLSSEELAAETDRGNGIGGSGCEQEVQFKSPQPQPRPQPRPQPQPTPQPAPQPQPRPQPAPQPQPTPAPSPGRDYDCSDFSSSAEAQRYLLPGDPYGLDRDGDGKACDRLR